MLGGREWWQRTANKNGAVEGEWISMKKDWSGLNHEEETSGDVNSKVKAAKLRNMKSEAKLREKRTWKEGKAREAQRDKEAENGATEDLETPVSADPRPAVEAEAEETYSPELDDMR